MEYVRGDLDCVLIGLCSIKYTSLEDIKNIIEKGVDVNAYDNEALFNALQNGRLDIAKYLIEKGSDLNRVKNCALYSCAINAHFETVKYLIENDADMDSLDDFVKNHETRCKIFEYIKLKQSQK